jgi:outer membrane protein assembly factor BamB
MNEKVINFVTLIGTAFLGLVFLTWWLLHNPVKDFVENVPGMDNRPPDFAHKSAAVEIGAYFDTFEGMPSSLPGSWPRFRGADFDNISKENIKLIDGWGASGPDILWSVDLGEGHAGPVVSNGRVYILDYDEDQRADILRCFSLDDGREIWRRGYDIFVKRNHGMSRTVPAATDKYVVTVGPKCHVMCVDAVTGEFKWGIDLEQEYGTEVPLWYTGQCPLIDGALAVFAVGGRSLITAVDCETGDVVWETPNPNNWKMSHSSIMPFEINGTKMFLYCAIGGLVGIAAEGEEAGKILFESKAWNNNVIAPSPVHLGDGRIFLTAGYGAGSLMVRVKVENGGFMVDPIQALKPEEGIASEQQTPVFYKGHLFSILPKDAGPLRNQFVCCHPDDCSRFIWSSGKTNRFGLGPYIVADDKFFILSDDGILTVARASETEYVPLSQAKILDGVDAWGPMAIVNGRLLARDSRRMVCVDLRANPWSGE